MNLEDFADYRPLAGIRVLELGNYIAAPTAGRMLAEFEHPDIRQGSVFV